ncbi:MAG: 1-hydroxycarotenoid 3,4-desaturase CrtD [Bacteroidota bacterium]
MKVQQKEQKDNNTGDELNIAVIGSGIGGLGSAIRLAARGHKVTVYEQAATPGGKISQIRVKGFRFDTGPSLFTLPNMVDDLFELAGENPKDHFNYTKLPSSCKYFWDDGTFINAWQDTEKFADEIEDKTGVEAHHIKSFLQKSRRLYELTADVFMFNSLHKAANYFTPTFRSSMLRLNELDAFTTMHIRNKRWFSHPRITQMFDRYATYNGSNPYQTPATLNIIAHLEHNIGAFFPVKGMYSIAQSMYDLALRLGVVFHFNTPVQEIVVENKVATALKVNEQLAPYDKIVSNVDVWNLYRHLMPGQQPPKATSRAQRSSSALIFYWGIDREFPELEVHNILFANNYRQEFEHLFTHKTISPDPTVYLFISSKTVKGDAPPGKENWYVMINVPENTGQDWDEMIMKARRNIIERINKVMNTDIEQHFLFEKVADPRSIEMDTGSYGGSLYGNSSNNPFAAFMRHPNFRSKIKNLYFTGGSVHPGGGIPLCLASAQIVDREFH